MCLNCQPLIKAIDRYIAKVDGDLADVLSAEGYVQSNRTVKAAEEIEDEVAELLCGETDLYISEAEKSVDLETFAKSVWPRVKLTDDLAEKLETVFTEKFTEYMPGIIEAYIQKTDRELTLKTISKATTNWIKQWSGQLGELMKLDSEKTLEKILTTHLEAGDGIAAFTQAILDSGIRDEYYRARSVSITEVLRAHSVAQQEAFVQSPVVAEKMWRHTGSYRNEPRENHVDMDGQRVPVNEPYTLIGADGETYYPMYPRDTSLPPGESINCHCLSEPVVDESILGLSLEERQALQQQAIDEMDDDWEKQLDEENKAKAGIEET